MEILATEFIDIEQAIKYQNKLEKELKLNLITWKIKNNSKYRDRLQQRIIGQVRFWEKYEEFPELLSKKPKQIEWTLLYLMTIAKKLSSEDFLLLTKAIKTLRQVAANTIEYRRY